MRLLGSGRRPTKDDSLVDRLRDFDETRPSLPGEHWAAFGFGLYLLLRRRRTVVGRLASMIAGVTLVARALSGRHGAIAMWQRAERPEEAIELVDVAMPWPYDERVRIARTALDEDRSP